MKIFFIQIIIFISSFYFLKLRRLKKIPENFGPNIIEDIKDLLFILPEDTTVSFNNSLIH